MKKPRQKPKHHYDPLNKRKKHPLDFLYRIIFNIDGSPTDSYILYTLAGHRMLNDLVQDNEKQNLQERENWIDDQFVECSGYKDFTGIFLYKLFKHYPHQHLLYFTLSLIKRSRSISMQMYFMLLNNKSLNPRNKRSKSCLKALLLREISGFWGRRTFPSLSFNSSLELGVDNQKKIAIKFPNAYPDGEKNNLKKRFQKYLKTRELKNQIDNDLNSISIEPGVDSNRIEGSNHKNKFSIKMKTRFYSIPTKTPQTLQGCLIHLATLPSIFFPSPVALNYRNIFHLIPEKTVKRSINQNFFGQSITVLESLAEISERLRPVDVQYRQDMLNIEIELLNYELYDEIFAFNRAKGICFNTAKVMDSAKNVPFKVSFTRDNFLKDIKNQKKYRMELDLKESFLKQIYKLYKEDTVETRIIVDRLIEQLIKRRIEFFKSTISKTEIGNISQSIVDVEVPSVDAVNSELHKASHISLAEHNLDDEKIVKTIILKSGNLIQEQFCITLMKIMNTLFEQQSLNLKLFPYEIFYIDESYGYVEFLKDTLSIHSIKTDNECLDEFYDSHFNENSINAKKNFLNSFTAYSLLTYLLQVKDRHNGNILINTKTGSLMHIDFGFIMGQYPGVWLVESAPFKFTYEYAKIVNINEFKYLFLEGFKVLRKEVDFLNRHFRTYRAIPKADDLIKERLFIGMSEKEMEDAVLSLVDESFGNRRTNAYDSFQFYSEGYMK